MLLLHIDRKAYMGSPFVWLHLTSVILKGQWLGQWSWKVNVKILRFWKLISCKGAEIGHMLLLNINRKPYMGSPMTLTFHLEWHWKVNIKVTQISKAYIIFRKAAELGHMLLLNTNRKSYVESPSHDIWPWVTLKGQMWLIWSKIDTCIVRYCVRVSLDFNWFSLQQWVFDTSLQKIANVTPTAAVKQSVKAHAPFH